MGKNSVKQVLAYFVAFVLFLFSGIRSAFGQQSNDTTQRGRKEFKDSIYITRLDTLLHLQSWMSANQMEYTLLYNRDFKLVLAPNQTNNLSFGLSYRYLQIGIGFSPDFLNAQQDNAKKGQSEQFGFRTSLSIHRFNLSFDLSSVKGFYLKNSRDFARAAPLPDSPYRVFPNLAIGYFSTLLRYNVNRKFSTAALGGGTQIQRRSACTVLPSFQFATFKFQDESKNSGVQNESTYSTDLNLLFPVMGTLVLSPKFSATLGVGPSVGVDFFKSVSLDDSNKVVLSKGSKITTGYSLQTAISYNSRRFFAGLESRYRSYGHKIEDISRLIKQYSYFQLYIGWRLIAPRFAKKFLDWVNKISPINFD